MRFSGYSHSTILNITDFGDTKVFGAAVLPCVTIFKKGTNAAKYQINFNSIYLQQDQPESPVAKCKSIYECIKKDGYFIDNNQIMYRSRSGYYTIDQKKCSDPWVIGDKEQDRWLEKVNQNTWKTFDEIGKVRVGIKTTADNIFLFNKDAKSVDIELIKELITHRNAGCYLANNKISWSVLYPHKSINGKKTVIDIDLYPKTKSYLLEHFDQLNNRNYIKKAKRKWYEIWVPQNPALWSHRKIVFRDITEFPQFWYVSEDAVVNGDCYWIDFNNTVSEEIIYLMLAVANSQFIVNFYPKKRKTYNQIN